MGGPSAPSVFDPNAVAGGQGIANANAAMFNQNLNNQAGTANQAGSMVNQTGPHGSLTYNQTGTGPGGVPLYTATTQLSPADQALLSQLQNTQTVGGSLAIPSLGAAYNNANAAANVVGQANTQAGGAYGTTDNAISGINQAFPTIASAINSIAPAFATAGAGANTAANATSLIPNANSLLPMATRQFQGYDGVDPSAAIGGATSGNTKAMLGQMTSYLKPFQDQETEQLDNTLRNQGFAPGQPGYDNAMGNLQKSHSAAVTNALVQLEPQAYNQSYTNFMTPSALGTSMANAGKTAADTAGSVAGIGQTQANIGGTQGQLSGVLGGLGGAQGTLASIINQIAGTRGNIAGTTNNIGSSQGTLAQILQAMGIGDAALGQPGTPTINPTPGLNIAPAATQAGNFQGATTAAQDALNQQYQQQTAQNNNMMSGIFGIPTALAGGFGKSAAGSNMIGSLLSGLAL